MKKFLVAAFWVLCSLFAGNSITFAHNWQFACFLDANLQAVYIDTDSVIEFNSIISFGKPHFQALFKTNDGTLTLCSFSIAGGTKFIYPVNITNDIGKLLTLQSSREQEGDYYRQLREQGYNEYAARKISREKGGDFQINNINQLCNGFQTYGLDSDSSINPIGMNLLYKLTKEDPTMANYLINSFRVSTNFSTISYGTLALKLYDVAFDYSLKSLAGNF